MKRFFVLVLALGFIFAGCAKRAVTTQPEELAPQEVVQKAVPQEVVQKAVPPEVAKEEKKAEPEKIAVVPVKEVVETKPIVTTFENIHFDFDKYNIRDDAKPTLKSVSDYLIKNKSLKMLIEGHTCEIGTNEYNLALGERRAKSTRDYLVSLGVAKDRLDTISYGEERPFCTESKAEECLKKNRRAQFILKQQ